MILKLTKNQNSEKIKNKMLIPFRDTRAQNLKIDKIPNVGTFFGKITSKYLIHMIAIICKLNTRNFIRL